jgi:hypothetical protein
MPEYSNIFLQSLKSKIKIPFNKMVKVQTATLVVEQLSHPHTAPSANKLELSSFHPLRVARCNFVELTRWFAFKCRAYKLI